MAKGDRMAGKNKKIKVGLIIDEFFGAAGTAYGGYGFLARRYVAKYIPNDEIQIDVLLGKRHGRLFAKKFEVDGVTLYRLPKYSLTCRRFLKRQNYDIFLSIEITSDWVLPHVPDPKKKLIFWIQDPRPLSAWENTINTMQSIKDPYFYSQTNCEQINDWNKQGLIRFISQGNCLNQPAFELYDLPHNTPVTYLPNPIEIDTYFRLNLKEKKKQIIFLGRLEAQKRVWLFCEIAKKLPEYEFYVLGQFCRHLKDNHRMTDPYINAGILNLHFMGHVDGKEKIKLIRESRLLICTSIWEGIPISWLECLSYGTLIVSDLEREGLIEKFGEYVGEVLGDGFDGVERFLPAIKKLMENDDLYVKKAEAAIAYIRETHNIPRFVQKLREIIKEEAGIGGRQYGY
jgi:glycosyltransferase involved in cell wall biosynthesis